MPNIRSIDIPIINDLFRMGAGFVLDFSDKTFSAFFAEELNIDIDDPVYAKEGASKAKRLRFLLQTVDKSTAARILNALWEYRELLRARTGESELSVNAHGQLLAILSRLASDTSTSAQTGSAPKVAFQREMFAQLKQQLLALAALNPHPRGYAFEEFLKSIFDRFGLEAREPFRLRGEQIDGSFLLAGETYLLEGKWQNAPAAIDLLHTFHGKVEQKAAWTRGLMVSYSGFSEDALHAFGRGKRVICMDGLDLSESLERELPLNAVLERKVRAAAETGKAFVRVRELF